MKIKKFYLIGVIFLSVFTSFSLHGQNSRKGHLKLSPTAEKHTLQVKFNPTIKAVANEKGNLSLGIDVNNEQATLAKIVDKYGLKFDRLIKMNDNTIERLEQKALKNAKKRAALKGKSSVNTSHLGLASLYKVYVSEPTNEKLLAVGKELEKLHGVVYCDLLPVSLSESPSKPSISVMEPTPDFTGSQGYLGPNPGVDIEYVWTLGAKGRGVEVADIEYAFTPNGDHEDIDENRFNVYNTLHPKVPDNFAFDGHGIAVAGMLVALDNGFGVTGLCNELDNFHGFQQWAVEYDDGIVEYAINQPQAMMSAAAILEPGDILLLEFQFTDPNDQLVPGEWRQDVWDATRTITDLGIIVVATGSNGNTDMDDSDYDGWRNRGHSGAIMVGAGTSDTNHDKLQLSTFGSRFDLQGWGHNITTLGWGGQRIDDDPNRIYTGNFGGTSGAGPMVVGVIACIQSYAQQVLGFTMNAQQMRDLLVETAIPQGSGGKIGPFPNARAAMDRLISENPLSAAFENISGDTDGDGELDPGESANINVIVSNNSATPTGNITLTASSENPLISISNPSQSISALTANANTTVAFNVTASSSIPIETMVEFKFGVTDGARSTESTKLIQIGTIPRIDFAETSFNESDENDGTISNSIALTLVQDEFSVVNGALTQGIHYSISNVPSGLSAQITTSDQNNATLSLIGVATSHLLNNSIDNMTLTFLDAALSSGDTSQLVDPSETFTISFVDPYQIVHVENLNFTVNEEDDFDFFKIRDRFGEELSINYGVWFQNGLHRFETYQKPMICVPGTENISLLSENTLVASNPPEGTIWNIGGPFPDEHNLSTPSYSVWNNKTGFAGFVFKKSGKYHYGWFRFFVNTDQNEHTLLEYAWNEAPNAPILTGQTQLESQNPPISNFTANTTSIAAGQSVTFNDLSSNFPTSWNWSFEGGSPSSSTSQSPTVTYNSTGTFDVTLTTTNSQGSDTEIKTNFITVSVGADTEAPTAPSNLTANNITQTTVDLNWNASSDNVGVTNYRILNGSNIIATVSGTSHTVTGLTASTSYTYSVVALDAAGNQSSASNSVNVTTLSAPDTQSPSTPSNLTANNITQSSVNLSWSASTDNVAVTGYNVLSGSTIIATVTGTSHTVTGLAASTSYTYSVVALDAAGNQSSASNNVTVTTLSPPDTQAPSIPSNLTASNITQSSVNLSWSASTDNVAVTGYNVLSGSTIIATVTGTNHTVSGLTPNTSYTYSVLALDAAGNQSSASNSVTVTTLDVTTPEYCEASVAQDANVINRVQLASIDNSSNWGTNGYEDFRGISTNIEKGTTYTLTISPEHDHWPAVDVQVWIDWNQNGVFDSSERVYAKRGSGPFSGNITVPTNAVNGNTGMRVRLAYNRSPDPCGFDNYQGEVEDYTVNIMGAGGGSDTQAPSAPTNLTASGVTQSSVNLNWNASSDNVGVTSYRILSGSNIVANVSGTSHSVTGLTANTSYTYRVVALDAAGNQSSASNIVSITTLSASDTQAPSAPTNLTASGITQSSVNLSWNASSDNIGVTGYNVLSGSTIIATVTGTNYTVTGLQSNTNYAYSVVAFDAAGNQSNNSNTVNVTTLDVTTPDYCEASVAQDANIIERVQLGSIDNSSNWGANGYQDHSTVSTDLAKGTTYTLTISPEHDHWPAVDVQVWIDWNQNGVFDSSERVYAKRGSGPFSGNITVPTNAVNGNTGMRVRLAYNRSPGPCGFDNYQGEVEDYTVNIVSQSNFISSDNKVSLDVKKLKNAIHAYPNPTEGVFQIQTESGSSISIFNQAGKMVYEIKSSETINEINLDREPGGLYFIKVNNSKGTLTTKLIVLN